MESVLRFLAGGLVVAVFAAVAEVFRPKSFAGLFNAAPSIALATIGITIAHHGKAYAAVEARSMICGAVGFFLYAGTASRVLMRFKPRTLTCTVALLPLWFGVSMALYLLVRQ